MDDALATVTVLSFRDIDHKQAAVAVIREIVPTTSDLPGLSQIMVVDAGPTEAVLITVYSSRAAAEQAQASVRPHLGSVLGEHVTRPPQRWAGSVILQ